MGKNIKRFLVAIILLVVMAGFSGYGYFVQHQYAAVIWAVVAGILLSGVDWVLRKPGRKPNGKIMTAAYAVGILGGPVVSLFWGGDVSFSIAVYLSALCLPLLVYILIVTLVFASKTPGFWSR